MADIKSSSEEEYFHKQETERIANLRAQAAAKKAADHEQQARAAAIGRCPKDGAKLEQLTYLKVMLDRCPDCQGIWLDRGEGRAILAAEAKSGTGFFTDFIRGVTGGKKEQSPL